MSLFIADGRAPQQSVIAPKYVVALIDVWNGQRRLEPGGCRDGVPDRRQHHQQQGLIHEEHPNRQR
jgi:hypothetical protein